MNYSRLLKKIIAPASCLLSWTTLQLPSVTLPPSTAQAAAAFTLATAISSLLFGIGVVTVAKWRITLSQLFRMSKELVFPCILAIAAMGFLVSCTLQPTPPDVSVSSWMSLECVILYAWTVCTARRRLEGIGRSALIATSLGLLLAGHFAEAVLRGLWWPVIAHVTVLPLSALAIRTAFKNCDSLTRRSKTAHIGLIVSVVCCATGALSLAVEWSACAVTSAALPAGSVYIVSGSCAGFKSEPLASGNHVWAMGLALAMLLSGIETLRYISAAKAIAVQSTVCVLTFSLPGGSLFPGRWVELFGLILALSGAGTLLFDDSSDASLAHKPRTVPRAQCLLQRLYPCWAVPQPAPGGLGDDENPVAPEESTAARSAAIHALLQGELGHDDSMPTPYASDVDEDVDTGFANEDDASLLDAEDLAWLERSEAKRNE